MNITYLIGNGFDLGLGLKTRFSDFLPEYIQIESQNEAIKRFKQEIDKNIENWSDFELELGKYTVQFQSNQVETFLDIAEDFKKQFIHYLKKEQERYIVTDTVAKKIARALYWMEESSDILRDEPRKELVKMCRNQIIKFSFIDFNYTDVLDQILGLIYGKQLLKTRVIQHRDLLGSLVHVHGAIGKSPIIGVNDYSQVDNKDFMQDPDFRKLLIKPEANKSLQRGFEEDAKQLLYDSDMICVYGMSLGATDKQWWVLLREWAQNHPNRYVVIFDLNDKYEEDSDRSWLKSVRDLQYKFLKHSFDDIKKEELPLSSGNYNILCVFNRKIFEAKLINKEEFAKEVAAAKESDSQE